jgi:hypothetical protein
MNWRLAKSLEQLREEINEQFPNRSRASDGSIGDAKHASRNSDHNPWVYDREGQPVVTAIDITNDPVNGLDSEQLAEALLASRDPRIKYVISNKKIASGWHDGPKPWSWRKYGGKNAHNHHVHISVEDSEGLFDNDKSWSLDIGAPKGKPHPSSRLPVIRRGDSGAAIEVLQNLLIGHGYAIDADGEFGPATDKAVKAFQNAAGLEADGIVGPYTWDKLGE